MDSAFTAQDHEKIQEHLSLIADQLINNEVDSDDEMVNFLHRETGVSLPALTIIVTKLRTKILVDMIWGVNEVGELIAGLDSEIPQ